MVGKYKIIPLEVKRESEGRMKKKNAYIHNSTQGFQAFISPF